MQTVMCPNCHAICSPSDPTCFKCRAPIAGSGGGGLTHSTVANLTAMIFAVGMMAALVAFVPMKAKDGIITNALATGIMVGLAGLVGRVVGWVIGVMICKS